MPPLRKDPDGVDGSGPGLQASDVPKVRKPSHSETPDSPPSVNETPAERHPAPEKDRTLARMLGISFLIGLIAWALLIAWLLSLLG